jgi:hypothetical protein
MAFSNFFSNNPAFQQRLTEQLQAEANKKKQLEAAAAAAGNFAGQGEAGYGAMTGELAADRAYQRDIMTGKNSLSGEQLRQGLQQNMAAQRSMAASATPQNAVMASRNAMNNMNRAGIGMSGQAAMAGIQERAAAEQALARMMMEQRGQSMQGAIGSRGNAISGYGGVKPEGSTLDKWGPAISAAGGWFGNRGGGGGGK